MLHFQNKVTLIIVYQLGQISPQRYTYYLVKSSFRNANRNSKIIRIVYFFIRKK